ncbi:PAS-domain containing protein [Sphingomonas sp. LHG3406-1]|uniref:PAS-domain containing protein n=1 Tax=Sphingomonas sp. LHG3406-1 TaxID=2804617 RepID=UPI002613F5A3|nr:PAS-domain containing protein [Sphingomonas sp. LHG3406-1]
MGSALTILVALGYAAALFAVAFLVDRKGLGRFARPAYTLSLAVYFTSWTFFGAVGTAARSGWDYLAIYLGPALVLLFAPALLGRLTMLAKAEGASSIADFISARHGRSRAVAALITLFALIASIPYIALQIRALSSSFAALTGVERGTGLVVGIAAAVAAFAIIFGARRVEVSSRNDGVIAAVAVESVVKLVALLALGLFAWASFASAPDALREVGQAAFDARFPVEGIGAEFLVQTLLSACAILCLPRMFAVAVVAAPSDDALRRARWPFLLYFGAVSLVVLPLTLAGLSLAPGASPDLFVLDLPLSAGVESLALLAFIGGLSAATGMIVVETLALSTMAANDLFAPMLLKSRRARSEADLGRLMLAARRLIITAIVAAALVYAQAMAGDRSLAAMGLIAFAGVAQFAPALVATVLFDLSNRNAALAGLSGGLALWTWCLFLPSVVAQPIAPGSMLDPHALFGWQVGSPLVHGSLWSLGVNIALLSMTALLRPELRRRAAEDSAIDLGHVATMGELKALVARFVGDGDAEEFLRRRPAGAAIDAASARRAERLIAGVIGAPSARLIVTSTMAGASLDVGDVVRLLDEGSQSLRFSRKLLSATLQALDPGVSVVDRNLRLIAWNPRYLDLFDYPEGLVGVGTAVADLIRFNAERGECGPGEVERHVERRLEHLRRGQPHVSERLRPSGRWIKMVGGPMPGGGYVTSFTDITAEKQTQAELEARVEARTRDLAQSNEALGAAKAAAEKATRDKTRFLAAASHDLLQPLHAARLFCTALEQEADERTQPLVRNIDRAIGSADLLLRALLDVSRLDAGGVQPRPETFALGGLIDELVQEFAPLAAERGLRLRARGGDGLVETDRSLFRSVLQNFLSNAIRYTAAGSIFVGARRRGEQLVVEVRDSGAGIADADLQRIFREFERLETPGSAGAGVGLGLAIVERIARLLDLKVEVRSAPGRGSTFSVALPAAGRASTPAPASPQPSPTSPIAGLTVLCVDNDPAILAGLDAALRSRGARPVLAGNAVEALAAAAGQSPAVALLDFHLGDGRDGLDLAAALRDQHPGLPIAIITADKSVISDPRSAGLNVLMKPIEPGLLWSFIGACRTAPA